MITSLICFSILSIPTVYELWNERTGEKMKAKKLSMFVRAVIIIGSVWVAAVFKNDDLLTDLLKSAALAFGIFFMFFDYSYNIMFHGKTKVWYSYLSKSPIDKAWSGWNWKWRMVVRVVIFIGAAIWFYVP